MPIDSLTVLVAHADFSTRGMLRESIENLGHEILDAVDTGRRIVEKGRLQRPDMVVTGLRLLDGDGIEALLELAEDSPLPAVVIVPEADSEVVERAVEDHVMACLVEPVAERDLKPAIELAWLRFEQFQSLQQEVEDLKQALEDRKLIERAKGVLMRRNDWDEPEAFRRLQKLSSEKRRRMAEVAEMILTADEAIE